MLRPLLRSRAALNNSAPLPLIRRPSSHTAFHPSLLSLAHPLCSLHTKMGVEGGGALAGTR